MLGLLGLGTGKSSFNSPLFGFFRIAIEPVRFTYRALFLNLAKVLLRPSTLLFITVLSFIAFDLDFEVVWEEGEEDDAGNNNQNWEDPAAFHRLGT
jgi:hypothetical protein